MLTNHHFDLSAQFNNKTLVTGLMWCHNIGLDKKQNFKLTYGLRTSGMYSSNVNYTSAPPKYWLKSELSDTLLVQSPQVNNFTLTIGARYYVKKFELGFLIDAIGVSFGGQKKAEFRSNSNVSSVDAGVSPLTALLIGANDRGMVKADFFLGYWVSTELFVKLVLSDMFTEYITPKGVYDTNGNTRFRAETMILGLGISYSPPMCSNNDKVTSMHIV